MAMKPLIISVAFFLFSLVHYTIAESPLLGDNSGTKKESRTQSSTILGIKEVPKNLTVNA